MKQAKGACSIDDSFERAVNMNDPDTKIGPRQTEIQIQTESQTVPGMRNILTTGFQSRDHTKILHFCVLFASTMVNLSFPHRVSFIIINYLLLARSSCCMSKAQAASGLALQVFTITLKCRPFDVIDVIDDGPAQTRTV